MPRQQPPFSPEIKLWRKRLKAFQLRKKQLLAVLAKAGFSRESTRSWLNTPLPELDNRTPKQLLRPYGIKKLLAVAKKKLTPVTGYDKLS